MLEVDVRKVQGDFSIAIRFACDTGVTAVFGRSGAGKTSLVNMLGGLSHPDSGRIAIGDHVLFDSARKICLPPYRRRLGYVFQEGRLFPHLTVRQNLLYGRWFQRRNRDGYEASFDHVVDMLGIGHLLKRRPRDLSGGEKQRIAIGRALLSRPSLLLMDEPLASLDQERKGEILPYLEKLRDEARIPVIYVSHSIEEVAQLADFMVLLEQGEVVASGRVEELSQDPGIHPLVARLDSGAVIDATITSHCPEDYLTEIAFPGGVLQVGLLDFPVGTRVRARVQARDVILSLEKPSGCSIRNILPGQVVDIRDIDGRHVSVRVNVAGTMLLARITAKAARSLDLAPERPVHVLLKSVAMDPRMLNRWHSPEDFRP